MLQALIQATATQAAADLQATAAVIAAALTQTAADAAAALAQTATDAAAALVSTTADLANDLAVAAAALDARVVVLEAVNPQIQTPAHTASIAGDTLTLTPGLNLLDSPDGSLIRNVASMPDGSFGTLRIICQDSGLQIQGESFAGNIYALDTTLPASSITYFSFAYASGDCALLQLGPSKEF